MKQPAARLSLCDLSILPDPGARGFELELDGSRFDIFIVRRGDKVWGYHNRCPHTGVPLEWIPNQFLDAEGQSIQCATHGALFTFDTGRCWSGPCRGRSLRPAAIEVRRGQVIFVHDTEASTNF